jgi:flagellar biosynthesis/type III secretory pathway protein FliH
MRFLTVKNMILSSVVGLVAFVATGAVSAQTAREYRDWQRAQREAERERQEYMMTRSPQDYREWQRAQREAQRERMDYVAEARDDRRDMNRGFRYYRNGRYYTTDARGASLLRQAINSGYQQGYREGQMDRRYGRGFDYDDSSLYRGGLFGYQSYIDRSQYQHYFQQGFQRGYEDGYHSRMRYGTRSGSGFSILGNVLNTILNITDN